MLPTPSQQLLLAKSLRRQVENMPNTNKVVKQVLARLMLLALTLTPLSLVAVEPIKISIYTNYPPYLYHEDGQHTGLYLKIVDLTLKAIDQAYTVEVLPFKRGLYHAAAGDSIIVGILKTDQRMNTLDFSEPFYQERVSVYFNHQQHPRIKSVEELDGLRIGTLLGWSYGTEFDQAKANNRFFTKDGDLETNFYTLAKGRLDAVIHSELSTDYILNKLKLKDEVFLGSEALEIGNIYFAVKKGTHKTLLDRINKKLADPDHIREIDALIDSYKN